MTIDLDLYNRLVRFVRKYYRVPADLAADAAMHAILKCIENENCTFSFGAPCAKNFVFAYYRNRRTRNEDYFQPIGSNGLPQDFPEASMPATQELRMLAVECLEAIENLSPKIRAVLRLVAQEYTYSEISQKLKLPISEISWRAKYGRKLLRQREAYELVRKRGHHQYIGIRRTHRKWQAAIRRGEEYWFLGNFDTASQAAKAYDQKAIELFGASATHLNFPL